MKTYAEKPADSPVGFEHTRPVFIPDDLARLHGPDRGVVELPIHLDWSGSGSYDLSRPNRIRSLYGTVIRQATSEHDLEDVLNQGVLRRHWRTLHIAPHIRHAWEAAHPELVAC